MPLPSMSFPWRHGGAQNAEHLGEDADYPHLFENDTEAGEFDDMDLFAGDSLHEWYVSNDVSSPPAPVPNSGPATSSSPSPWQCLVCGYHAHTWNVDRETWVCDRCHASNFHDLRQPTRRETPTGTWVYVPHGQPEVYGEGNSNRLRRRRQRRSRRLRHGPPDDPPDDDYGQEEQAESEVLTHDPVVEVSTHLPTPPRTASMPPRHVGPHRRAAQSPRGQDAPEQAPPVSQAAATDPVERLANVLTAALTGNKKHGSSSSTDSWISAKGPQPGVKFRGGAAPAPPSWSYAPNDIRAYERYERKVRMWQLQARHHMTDKEVGIALFNSLRGEAELELEFTPMEEIYCKEGVDNILAQLKQSFQQRTVYVKRQYLHEYEVVGRWPGESMRSFTNRYKRIEKSLLAIGVNVALTYDSESRGSRLLDRSRLSLEQQRLVLVGTAQSLDFEQVRSALMLQYPEHKPPPAVSGRGETTAPFQAKANGKGFNNTTSSTPSSGHQHGGKGKGFHKGPRKVFQTEAPDAEAADEAAADEDLAPIDEGDEMAEPPEDAAPDDAGSNDQAELEEADDFNELANVLTVTARKLATMTQGRKFSGQPRRSLAERKRNSVRAACGEKGHWAGDSECTAAPSTASATSNPKGKGKGSKSRDGNSSSDSKKVMTVYHHTGFDTSVEYIPSEDPPEPHFAMMVCSLPPHLCFTTSSTTTVGHMIIDTACQRSCCGSKWFAAHTSHLLQFRLKIHQEPSRERFQFGSGSPRTSTTKAWIPAAINQQCLILGANVLNDVDIPYLCSLSLLNQLGTVIDLTQGLATFTALQTSVPLHRLGGHLAVSICDFPMNPNRLAVWGKLFEKGFDNPEVATVMQLRTAPHDDSCFLDSLARDLSASTLAEPLPHGRHGRDLQPDCEAAMEAPLPTTLSPGEAGRGAAAPGTPPGSHEDRRLQVHHGRQDQRDGRRQGEGHEGPEEFQGQVKPHDSCTHKGSSKDSSGIIQQCHRGVPEPGADGMPPSSIQAPRQSPRLVRDLHSMHGTMAMGRHRLEAAWVILQIVTASTLFLDGGRWFDQAAGLPKGRCTLIWPLQDSQSICFHHLCR